MCKYQISPITCDGCGMEYRVGDFDPYSVEGAALAYNSVDVHWRTELGSGGVYEISFWYCKMECYEASMPERYKVVMQGLGFPSPEAKQ